MTAGLRLRVHPGAKRTGVVGWMADGTLKLSVKEPPEGGRANRALIAWLAAALGVREAAVRVVRGQGGRTKTIEVDGMDEATLRVRLTAGVAPGRAPKPGAAGGGHGGAGDPPGKGDRTDDGQ